MMNRTAVNSNPVFGLAGFQSFANFAYDFYRFNDSYWMDGIQLDEFHFYKNRTLSQDQLGYYQTSFYRNQYCFGYFEELTSNLECFSKGFANDSCGSDIFSHPAVPSCSASCEKDFIGFCNCEQNEYQVWKAPVDPVSINFSSAWPNQSPGSRILTEIEFYDPLGNLIPILSCSESGTATTLCARLSDSQKQPNSLPFISSSQTSFHVQFQLQYDGPLIIDEIVLYIFSTIYPEWNVSNGSLPLFPLDVFSVSFHHPGSVFLLFCLTRGKCLTNALIQSGRAKRLVHVERRGNHTSY